MVSRIGANLFLFVTLAQIGSLLYIADYLRKSHLNKWSSLRSRRVDETKNLPGLKEEINIPWNNQTWYELAQAPLAKYMKKTKDELDIIDGIGIGAALTMMDPMGGRSAKCLEICFRNWLQIRKDDIPRNPLFETFFEWLDFGDGKDRHVLDASFDKVQMCNTSSFDLARYIKFTATQRAMTEIRFDVDNNNNGGISNISFVNNNSNSSQNVVVSSGIWSFVWGIDRNIYLVNATKTFDRQLGHPSIFCGRPVLFAGEMGITKGGTIKWINDESGHYRPKLRHMRNFCKYLRDEKGVNTTSGIEWRQRNHTLQDPLASWPVYSPIIGER